METLPSDMVGIKVTQQTKMSAYRFAQIVEKIISDHNLATTSSNEIETLFKTHRGVFMITTKSSALFHALKTGFDAYKFNFKVVKGCPQPKRTNVHREALRGEERSTKTKKRKNQTSLAGASSPITCCRVCGVRRTPATAP